MRLKKKVYSEKIEFEYFINVTTEGLFTAYLPEEVVAKMDACGLDLGRGRGGKRGYFEASTLKEIEERIRAITEKFSKKNLVSTKIVLRYEIITACTYCKTKAGEIVPNGGWQQKIDKTDNYHWINGTGEMSSNRRQPFGFQIYVEPFRKNVYSFPDKSTHTEYVHLEDEDIKEGTALEWLNEICGISCEDDDNVKDIDYTEEVALFFKNALMYVCNLNERLQKLFGEQIVISLSKVKMLPSPMEKG